MQSSTQTQTGAAVLLLVSRLNGSQGPGKPRSKGMHHEHGPLAKCRISGIGCQPVGDE